MDFDVLISSNSNNVLARSSDNNQVTYLDYVTLLIEYDGRIFNTEGVDYYSWLYFDMIDAEGVTIRKGESFSSANYKVALDYYDYSVMCVDVMNSVVPRTNRFFDYICSPKIKRV